MKKTFTTTFRSSHTDSACHSGHLEHSADDRDRLRPSSAFISLLRFCIFTSAVFLASAAVAANIYTVRRGSFESLFGKTEEDVEAAVEKANDKQIVPFSGDSSLSGTVSYSPQGFEITLFGKCGKSIGDAALLDGAVIIQLREGMENRPTSRSPMIFQYTFGKRPAVIPAKPRGEPTGVEEDSARAARNRLTSLLPDYPGVFSRSVLPDATFTAMRDGWRLNFTFQWAHLLKQIPFTEGKYPESWRMAVTYRKADGSVASWGDLANPVVLSWARSGDAFIGEIQNALFMSQAIGPSYSERENYYETYWTTHRMEKYIGYINPGKETFEIKNPDSDELFFVKCAEPLIKANANLQDVLFFDWRNGPAQPKVMSMAKTFRDEIYSQLDRVYYFDYFIRIIRRDYLLARFTDRPVLPPPPAPSARNQQPKAKPASGSDGMTLDDVEVIDGGLELDDIAF